MKGGSGQVQTVSIIDTISELASNQGDRAKITQVAKLSARPRPSPASHAAASAASGSLSLSSSSPASGPRAAVSSSFLATNINISQMSLPPTPGPAPGPAPAPSRVYSSRVGVARSPAMEEFASGLGRSSGQLNSTLRSPDTEPGDRRQRRRKKMRPVKSAGRGQGETPDWIKDLFNVAKRGNLERLAASLSDMERTLVRNLTDHLGNNLVHVVARHGHAAQLLPWLATRLGPELEPALADENKRGLTPATLAIKHGQQEAVAWLVENTRDRERLASNNGERCLLHAAARYGQDGISGWLCEEMTREGLEVDQMDVSGNTPLHLAAARGNTATAAALLNLGASVNMKNDMGLKPSDCAAARGRDTTAEFLVMFETALGVTKELLHRERAQDTLAAEAGDIKTNFKDVLSVSKKLTKEREEMCRDLGRLHESMLELHDKMIMEMQVLAQENSSLRRGGQETQPSLSLDATIEQCDSLHERWQHHQKQYFSSSLADLEHRILLAEDSLKKHKSQPHLAEVEQSYAHRNLRDRLEELRVSSSSVAARRLSPGAGYSSDTASSGEDEAAESDKEAADTNLYEAMRSPGARVAANIAQRKKLATPSPIKSRIMSDPNMEESVYSSLSSPMYSTIGDRTQQLSATDISGSGLPDFSEAASLSFQRSHVAGLDYNSAKVAASEIARSGGEQPGVPVPVRKEDRRRSRTDLKKRLKQLALTSETGSASVIEVIEPNSSEEEEFKKSMHEMNLSWAAGKSLSLAHSPAEPQTPVARTRRVVAAAQAVSPAPSSRTSKTSDSSSASSKQRHVSDTAGRAPSETVASEKPKNLLRSEPDILAGVRRVGQDTAETADKHPGHNQDTAETLDDMDLITDDFGEEFYSEDLQMLPYDLESERCDSSLQMKKKGFLQKLSISKWAAKKKSSKSSTSKIKEIPPEDFRETYLSGSGSGPAPPVKTTQAASAVAGSGTKLGVTRITVGQDSAPGPGLSLATSASDDSGIIARLGASSSAGSKSDSQSLSRPDSSSSSEQAATSARERVSPIGSEQAKRSPGPDTGSSKVEEGKSGHPSSQLTTIITLNSSSSHNNNNNHRAAVRKTSTVKTRSGRRSEEKPWYDVSDEDVEVQTPDHITSIISVRGSSDEDPF